MCKTAIFSAKPVYNMRESQQLFFGLRVVSRIFEELQHPAIQTKIVLYFGGFFQQTKVCQPIERKDSVQAVCLRLKRLEAFLYLAAQNFELFYKIQDQNKKIKKPIAVEDLSEAYLMVPISFRSNLEDGNFKILV